MDPVLEVKEEIDLNNLKFAPFKKLKFIHDVEEDNKIGSGSTPMNLHRFYIEDEAIEEDNRENDLDVDVKFKKYHTVNIKKFPESFDKSESFEKIENSNNPKNYITEEIKEEYEEIQDSNFIPHNTNCKFFFIFSKTFKKR